MTTPTTNPDPEMHYFAAVDNGDDSRPDTVQALERRGYKRSEKILASQEPGSVLMEIPLAVFEAMRAAERAGVPYTP